MMTQANVEALQKFIGAGSVSIVRLNFQGYCDEAVGVSNQGTLTIGLRKAQATLYAKFIGVRSIEFRSGSYNDVVLGGLVVELMTDYQWPNINVRVVSEMEDTMLSFYSEAIELKHEIEQAQP